MPNLDKVEIKLIRRQVIHNGQKIMCQGLAAGSLRQALADAADDAVVMFASFTPAGRTIWTGTHAVITDFDGTGACVVLVDANIAKQLGGVG